MTDGKNSGPNMHGAVSSKFGALMMAICEADVVIAAKDAEISNLKAALADLASSDRSTQEEREPHQEMLSQR